jgi:hypothetical protein
MNNSKADRFMILAKPKPPSSTAKQPWPKISNVALPNCNYQQLHLQKPLVSNTNISIQFRFCPEGGIRLTLEALTVNVRVSFLTFASTHVPDSPPMLVSNSAPSVLIPSLEIHNLAPSPRLVGSLLPLACHWSAGLLTKTPWMASLRFPKFATTLWLENQVMSWSKERLQDPAP